MLEVDGASSVDEGRVKDAEDKAEVTFELAEERAEAKELVKDVASVLGRVEGVSTGAEVIVCADTVGRDTVASEAKMSAADNRRELQGALLLCRTIMVLPKSGQKEGRKLLGG